MHDLGTLILLQSVGLVLLPACIWALAISIQTKTDLFWPFVITWAIVFLDSTFVGPGEFIVTYALVALAASLLLREGAVRTSTAVGLIPIAIFLCKSYESMLFLGPLLACLTFLRMRQTKDESSHRSGRHRVVTLTLLGTSAALFLVACCLSIVALASPDNPAKPIGSAASATALLRDRQLVIAGLAGAMFMAAQVGRKGRVALGFVGAALLLSCLLFAPGSRSAPYQYHVAEVACGVALFAAIAICAYLSFGSMPVRRSQGTPGDHLVHKVFSAASILAPVVLTVALSCSFTVTAIRFHTWTRQFEQVVRSHKGLIAWNDSGLSVTYLWGWPNPSLSIVLQSKRGQAIVLAPVGVPWQPFNPRVGVPQLPEGFP